MDSLGFDLDGISHVKVELMLDSTAKRKFDLFFPVSLIEVRTQPPQWLVYSMGVKMIFLKNLA